MADLIIHYARRVDDHTYADQRRMTAAWLHRLADRVNTGSVVVVNIEANADGEFKITGRQDVDDKQPRKDRG